MRKKPKIELKDLKIQSFVTQVNQNLKGMGETDRICPQTGPHGNCLSEYCGQTEGC